MGVRLSALDTYRTMSYSCSSLHSCSWGPNWDPTADSALAFIARGPPLDRYYNPDVKVLTFGLLDRPYLNPIMAWLGISCPYLTHTWLSSSKASNCLETTSCTSCLKFCERSRSWWENLVYTVRSCLFCSQNRLANSADLACSLLASISDDFWKQSWRF